MLFPEKYQMRQLSIRGSNYKYDIKIPRTIKEELTLDSENGNTLWQDSIDLEMNTIL